MSNETFTVTETIVLAPGGDADLDGVIDPGETVRITVQIANNSTNPGATVATGLEFSQILNGMTLVDQAGNDVNVSPIAFNDSYTAIGNTLLEVGSVVGAVGPQSSVAGHVTDNDLEFFSDTFTISAVQASSAIVGNTITTTSANGGTVTMVVSGADMGSFTYMSAVGFTGADSFTYTIRDKGLDGIAGNSDDLVNTATVSVNVTNQVWYVDNSFAGVSNGTSTNPYKLLSDVSNGAGGAGTGDIIHVAAGNADYTGGITLLANQTLHGAGSALTVGGFNLTAAGGADPTITNAAGNGVTLAAGNTLAGFTVGNTTGFDIANTNTATVGNLTISNVVLNGTGGLIRADSGGSITATFDSLSTSNAGSTAILLTNVDGSNFTVTGTTIIDDATADGIAISNTQNSTFNFGGKVTILNDAGGANGDGVDLQNNNTLDSTFNFNGGVDITVNGTSAFGFRAQSSGVVNILNPNGDNQITSNNGTALFVNPTQFQASLNSVTAGDGGTGDGVHLEGVTGSGVTIGTVNITGVGGDGLDITNSTANITINSGTIGGTTAALDASGIGVDINGGTGNVTINATVGDATASGALIEVTGRSAGTVDFNGALTSAAGGGIAINTNTGGTVRFDGGMNLSTGTQAAFNASNNTGMTLVVTDPAGVANNVLATTTGTALTVTNTTIGAEDLTFQSISANGAVNGIVLNTTGTSGGLTITGSGASPTDGSGGTILNTSGDGVLLTSTVDFTAGGLTITGADGAGIRGTSVNGFVLNNADITGSGNDAAVDESGIELSNLSGTSLAGLHPTEIRNSTISNSWEMELQITNNTGTLSDFRLTNSTISSNGASQFHGNLFNFLGLGTAVMNLTVAGSSFTGNNTAPTNTGDAIFVDASGGTVSANIGTSTFNNNNVGANFAAANNGILSFNIHDNATITGNRAVGVNVFTNANHTGTVNGTIQNNVIGTQGVANSGSQLGRGIQVSMEGGGTGTFLITGNTVQSLGSLSAEGISVVESVTVGTTNATITNNLIRDIVDDRGLIVQVTNGGTMNTTISGNTFTNITGLPGDPNATVMRVNEGTNGGTLRIAQLTPTAGANANELDDANGIPATRITVSNTPQFGQPAPPLPLLAGDLPDEVSATPQDEGDTSGGVPDGGTGGEQDTPPLGDDQPSGETPPAGADPVPDASVILDDGFLSQAELDFFVDAARQRWLATGLSEEQIAALEALTFSVADMQGLALGSFYNGQVSIDSDGAGRGWFVDATPLEDSEFANAVSATRLTAVSGTAAAGRFDVLTTIMHEMGHALGLGDEYDAGARDTLLYGYLFAGERRLPGDEADGATPGSVTQEAFAGSLIEVVPDDGSSAAQDNLFDLPAGRTVTIQWDATVDAQTNQVIVNPVNSGTVTATNGVGFPDTTSNVVTTVLDSLTLGDRVFVDTNGNSAFDAGEGVTGVALQLYADTDSSGGWTPTDTLIATTTTAAGGAYSFTGLAPGDYVMVVTAANFGAGQPLLGKISLLGGNDPDNNVDNDDNGIAAIGGAFATQTITLAYNTEPTAGTGNDTNNTVDFGFVQPNQAPVNTVPGTQTINEDATRTFNAGNGNAISVSDVDAGAGNLTVTVGVNRGLLTLGGNAGLVFTTGDGTDDATMTFSGTVAAINTALNGLVYTPNAHFNGSATLTITTSDNGNTGADPGLTGGAADEQDSDTVTINITAINDAPVVAGDGTESAATINEDMPGAGETVSALFSGQYSDAADNQIPNGGASSPGAFSGIAVVANGSSGATGQWQYFNSNTSLWVDIGARTTATALLIGSGTLVRFNPALDFNGAAPTLTAHLIDNSLGFGITFGQTADLTGATGGTTAYSTGTVVLSQSVSASPVAQPDAVTTAENVVGTGSVFADNGSGADTDADGPALSVSAVNGVGASVGAQITLASGAKLTLGANGTYSYDPDGKFDYLISGATAAATGAVNTSASDSFTYTLVGGATATVTMTVTGVTSAGDQLWGDAGNNTIQGTPAGIVFNLGQGGEDTATGQGGNDGFYMGAELSALDVLDGGGGILDQLGLQGDYSAPFVFGTNHLTEIEMLVLLSGSDARFGDTSGASYSYNLKTIDANVGTGEQLAVSFNLLLAGENVTFDGSDESDGWFLTFGGLGNDTLIGGDQDDRFYFGNNGRWGAGDSVDGGAGTLDQLGLQGSYTVTFGAGQMAGIEMLVLLTGGDTRFGNPAGTGYSYDVTMDDGNVGNGQMFYVSANTLRAGVPGVSDETLVFDGSAESDGRFTIYSGAGNDTLTGGDQDDTFYGAGGADTITGGSGNDTFAYTDAAHSTVAAMDQILDFGLGDRIDLSAIDAIAGGANDAFAFIGAAVFGSVAGQLRAFDSGGGIWQIQGDIDGNGIADFVIAVTPAAPLASTDFLL